MVDSTQNTHSTGSKHVPPEENRSVHITGSTLYHLEMKAAIDSLTSRSKAIQKQAKENAKESGEQAPTIPSF